MGGPSTPKSSCIRGAEGPFRWRLSGESGDSADSGSGESGDALPQGDERWSIIRPDITGTDILEENPVTGKREFRFHRGPLFTNLLLNALRHSPEGGDVAIEVHTNARQLTVQVIDAGPGIPSHAHEQVFERFWRSSDQGGHSGLGLAIARSIARSHGGDIKLDASPLGGLLAALGEGSSAL